MSEWQDIETAPKDGTEILLYLPDHSGMYGWVIHSIITTGYWRDDDWRLVETGGYSEDYDIWPSPTHWMPLPKPPVKKRLPSGE